MEKADVFISYSSLELEEARIIKTVLEKNDLTCWMAPESIPAGSNYTKEIPSAIHDCKVFLIVLSKNAQESKWVPLELDRAFNEGKLIVPFLIEDCALTDDFNFVLAKTQRIEAYRKKSEALEKLVDVIKTYISDGPHPLPDEKKDEKRKKTALYAVLGVAAAVVLALGIFFLARSAGSSGVSAPETQAMTAAPAVPVTEPETTPETEPETEAKKSEIGTVGDYVGVARETSFTAENGAESKFRIPEILLESDDASDANDEIEERYGAIITDLEESGSANNYNFLDFDSYLNGEILSVVINSKYAYTNVYQYSVYNFSVTTGKRLTNRTLCKELGTTWDEMKSLLSDALKEEYVKNFPSFEGTDFQYTTLSSSNLEASQLYLGSFKTVMAVCTLYTGAGAGDYERVVEVTSYLY